MHACMAIPSLATPMHSATCASQRCHSLAMAGRAVLSSFTAPPPPPPGVQVEGAARELPGEEEGAPEGYTAAIDAWEVVEEEVFENERWNIQGGWGRRYLLGWDRPAWSSRQGQPRSKASTKLPEGWEWSDPDWTVDTAGLDANGWAYGLCWEGVGRRRQGCVSMFP